MVESKPEAWHDIIRRIEDTGADGIELNYGCPHGMSERGMGAAVGQVPEYCEQITRWVMEVAAIPVIVKLTPNVTNIVGPGARRGRRGRERAVADQHSELDHRRRSRHARDHAQHRRQGRARRIRGTCRQADRAEHARRRSAAMKWYRARAADLRHGRHHHLAGCCRVPAARRRQPAGLHRRDALRLPHHRRSLRRPLELDGLERLRDRSTDVVGKSLHRISDFKDFDLSFRAVARIDDAEVHPVQPLLRRLQRHRPSMHRPRRRSAKSSAICYASSRTASRSAQHAQTGRARGRLRRMPALLQHLSGGTMHRDGGSAVRAASPITWDQLVEVASPKSPKTGKP